MAQGWIWTPLTSFSLARHIISWKLFQLSSLRIGSLSSYPTWLSVATRILIVSAAARKDIRETASHSYRYWRVTSKGRHGCIIDLTLFEK